MENLQKIFENQDQEVNIKPLIKNIGDVIKCEYTLEEFDGTYEIDSDNLKFSFVIEGDLFEIRNIETTENGLGLKVLSKIHQFADENKMMVQASNVKDTARGFWEKMEYYEGATMGEFIRL